MNCHFIKKTGIVDIRHNAKSANSVPSKLKKSALSALFLVASRQKFWKSALANLDAISFTGENFAKQNFFIFSKMWGTYIHDLSRSQVTARIYSSERLKISDAVWKLSTWKFIKKFRAHFHDLCVQKQRILPWIRRILDVRRLLDLQKNFRLHLYDLRVQKRSCLPWSSDRFRKFFLMGAFSRFWGPNMKLFAIAFRCILEIFALWCLRQKFWAHFSIFASKTKTVCCEVQTHFGRSPLARFTTKFLGPFSPCMCPKMKLFSVKFRRI